MNDDQLLRDTVSNIQDTVIRIERAMIGDESLGTVGLVSRIERNERDIADVKQARRDEANQKRGAIFVLTSLGGIIGAGITWLINNWKTG